MNSDLFSQSQSNVEGAPLAERLRPKQFKDFVGQTKITNTKLPLINNLRERNFLPNLILWGPPGTGKTTFARLLSREVQATFINCNAIDTGAKELRQIGEQAHTRRIQFQEKTILFIDEIHRLNKSQQDILLPFTENGDITLIGATTENPSYELNSALLSRLQVLVFERLSNENLLLLLTRAAKEVGCELSTVFSPKALELFVSSAAGDARLLLNNFEVVINHMRNSSHGVNKKNIANESSDLNLDVTNSNVNISFPLQAKDLENFSFAHMIRYDKSGDEHYNVISAFIKSIRGSDPDAAIYYLARMLEGGEDPVFIARRLVISASEDIGNADPKALPLAVAGLQAVELVGMPEARINLAQVTTYLASAPKSNRAYLAINNALECVRKTGALPVPISLRSAQTKFVKNLGYGEGYKYSHDYPRGYVEQNFLPDEVRDEKFYEPTQIGFEKNIAQYLNWLRQPPK